MKRFIYWVYVVCLIVLASSCRSLRHAERAPMIGGLKGEEYQEKVISGLPHWNCVTGKVALNLNVDGGEEYEIIGYAPNEERRSHTIVGGSFAGH